MRADSYRQQPRDQPLMGIYEVLCVLDNVDLIRRNRATVEGWGGPSAQEKMNEYSNLLCGALFHRAWCVDMCT